MLTFFKRSVITYLFMSVHRMPRSIIVRWQSQKLQTLLKSIDGKVSVYNSLWDKNFDIKKVLHPNDLSVLPIITKQTLRGYTIYDRTNSSQLRGRLHWRYSSGTTGEPFKFVNVRATIPRKLKNFLTMRFLLWEGYSLSHVTYKLKIARTMTPEPSYNETNRLVMRTKDILDNPTKILKDLSNFKPDVIEGFPTLLGEIVEMYKEKNICTIQPRYVVSFGEVLSSSKRKYFKENFNCEIFNSYGLEEMGGIAVECKEHNGLHLNCESFILEIVDDHGDRVVDGTLGKVVLTDLYNFVMPLVRYAPGDFGKIIPEKCPCGLESPRLVIQGRHGQYLEFPQTKIHHFEIEEIMNDESEHVLQYQIVKESANTVRVLIRPYETYSHEVGDRILQRLQNRIGIKVHVSLNLVDRVHRAKSGKVPVIIDQGT